MTYKSVTNKCNSATPESGMKQKHLPIQALVEFEDLFTRNVASWLVLLWPEKILKYSSLHFPHPLCVLSKAVPKDF